MLETLFPIVMQMVFLRLSSSFLVFSESLTDFRPLAILSGDTPTPDNLVSSANKIRQLFCDKGMSFTYVRKRRRPKIDPCEIPQDGSLQGELLPCNSTLCTLFDKKLNHLKALPRIA